MNGLIVKLDFDVDSIFDEAFKVELNCMLRETVLDEFEKQIRATTIQIYNDNELDVSAEVLAQYKEEHAKFQASIKGEGNE